MAKQNLTKSVDIQVTMRAVDFATRFASNWEHLRAILGIMRTIRREPGTKLISKYAVVSSLAQPPAEGEAVSLTKAEVKEKEYATLSLERYAKSVTIDAINDHGFDVACQMTDDQFLVELQQNVVDRWYAYLRGGTLTGAGATFQMALAKAQGLARNKFKRMHKGITGVVGFCNILDVYDYLGAQNINNVEQEFGLNYIKNFLGYTVLFLLSEDEIPKGTVIATPVENINLYYVAPNESDFQRAGLRYVTDGETNMIGVAIQPDYNTGESITHALHGMTLFSEYIDGIAVVDIGVETFTAVSNPAEGANPSALKYYEKDATTNEYFRSTDTTVQNGKTYYTRAVSQPNG
jgi:hypothetical protein